MVEVAELPPRARAARARVPSPLKRTIAEPIAERVIRFIESVCRYPEGKLAGQLIVLPEFHKRAIRGIYQERAPGVLKHSTSILSWPRKSSKTGVCACLVIAQLCGPVAIKNSQMYSCAQSAEQASLVFKYAHKMIMMEPRLSERIRVRPSVKTMYCPGTGITYKALASDGKNAYGLSPQFSVFDELGQAGPEDVMWSAFAESMGAIFNPVVVIISTQAATDDALLSTLIDDAPNDDTVFLDLIKCPAEIDPLDLDRIPEWHPAWHEAWCNTQEIIKTAKRAARLPSARARYLNLIANRRVRADVGLFTPDVWDACNSDWDEAAAHGRKAWGGLDLSVTTDLTAWVLVVPLEDGTIGVRAHFFLPEQGIDERALKDRTDYREWERLGHLTLCPGAVIGYEWVLEQIMDDAGLFDIQEIAYDRYKMKVLRKHAEDAGLDLPTLVEHGQGFVSMASSITELENVVLKKELRHGGHPVLRNNIANAVIKLDPAGNRKFDKAKRTHRIDGAVALAMAVGQYRKTDVKTPIANAMIG
jgi:phage terminase large subunit-like protein